MDYKNFGFHILIEYSVDVLSLMVFHLLIVYDSQLSFRQFSREHYFYTSKIKTKKYLVDESSC